jgi:hypothetical protein
LGGYSYGVGGEITGARAEMKWLVVYTDINDIGLVVLHGGRWAALALLSL